jgi:hypothetical protein
MARSAFQHRNAARMAAIYSNSFCVRLIGDEFFARRRAGQFNRLVLMRREWLTCIGAGSHRNVHSLFQDVASMQGISTLSFVIEPPVERARYLSVVPVVSGVRLTKLVESYDCKIGNLPAGSFAGLVRRSFNFGAWDRYFMAEAPNRVTQRTGHYLLGCFCGEVSCWSLAARIVRNGELMIWDCFREPNKPERDYSSFGPFRFEIDQYRQAVVELASADPPKRFGSSLVRFLTSSS